MAFNINAQIVLSAPKNLNNVTKQISGQLSKATKLNINVGNTTQLNNISKQLTNISSTFTKLNSNLKSTRTSIAALNSSFAKAGSSLNTLGNAQKNVSTQTNNANRSLQTQQGLLASLAGRFGSVAKQAIAFGLISRPIYDLQRALTQSVKAAVAFEKEFVKISQVTGKSVKELGTLQSTINTLATSLGNSANELAETARVIAQTGKTAEQTRVILQALARSTLAPTFGTLKDTTEGLVAALGQFNLKASDSEAILGSLNRVSKNFAVEAEDLISVIRRTGGVFAQAAGNSRNTIGALQELISVFTAVRSTTRESADTIAAGLRTIFSRLQRRGTIEFLKQFGVQLTDAKGQFIGIFPAFDELSKRLDTLIKQGDALTLSAIAEELGGIRQIGKLLPAIANFDKARKALNEAQKGAVEGLSGDVAKGLDTVDNRVKRVRETFNQLIRTVFESDAFQNFTKNILKSAENFLKFGNSIVQALEPILPILTTIGAFKIGSALSGFLGGGLRGVVGGVTGQGASQAAAQASNAAAQATQNSTQATQNNTKILTTINSTLTRTSNQLSNIFQSLEGNFRILNTQLSNLIQAVARFPAGGRRRSGGGIIPKFANGGRVYGPSHAAGGVVAELEGGEHVIPKKYAKGYQPGGKISGIAIGTQRRLQKQGISGTLPLDGGKERLSGVNPENFLQPVAADALRKADGDDFGAAVLRPGDFRATFTGQNDASEISSAIKGSASYKKILSFLAPVTKGPNKGTFGAKGGKGLNTALDKIITNYAKKNKFKLTVGGLEKSVSNKLELSLIDGIIKTVKRGVKELGENIGVNFRGSTVVAKALKSANIDQTVGNIFESVLQFGGAPFGRNEKGAANAPFDFPSGLQGLAGKFGLEAIRGKSTDAKSTATAKNISSLNKKVKKSNLNEAIEEIRETFRQFAAKRPNVQSAQRIVAGFNRGKAKGRAAGGFISRFQTGGEVPVRISNGEMVVSDPKEVAARSDLIVSTLLYQKVHSLLMLLLLKNI
jgi:TP901 family phage tail tape measure protein